MNLSCWVFLHEFEAPWLAAHWLSLLQAQNKPFQPGCQGSGNREATGQIADRLRESVQGDGQGCRLCNPTAWIQILPLLPVSSVTW